MENNKPTDLVVTYPASRFTVMALQEDLQPHDHVRYEVVQVKVDPNQKKRGDVHLIDGGLYLAKNAIDRISIALGVIFDPDRTLVTKLSATEWLGRSVAARRNPDGTWQIRTGEYEWDAELRAEIDAKGDERKYARLVLENRKHGRSRAETGAKSRAIRALTGIKTSYSEAELNKPLVFVRHAILDTAPAHLKLSGQQVWNAPQQVTALPAPEDDEDTIQGEAEELPPEDEAAQPAAPAGAAPAAELPPDEDELPPADELPPDDTNVDPIGEAAIELGMPGPPDQRKYPYSYRLVELYADPRSERIRHQVKGMLGEELTESQAAQLCRRIENYQQRRQQ